MTPFADLIEKYHSVLMSKWPHPIRVTDYSDIDAGEKLVYIGERQHRDIWAKVIGAAMLKGTDLSYDQARSQAYDAYDLEVYGRVNKTGRINAVEPHVRFREMVN